MTETKDLKTRIEHRFSAAGLTPASVQIRTFPGEVIAVVEVREDYERALELAAELDREISGGLVTVRRVFDSEPSERRPPVADVHDSRVNKFAQLLNARARTSESQPSLHYVEDVAQRIDVAMAPRHHLVFGRRGVGKTALLLEAKRQLSESRASTLWVNVQPLRSLGQVEAFLAIAGRLCDLLAGISEEHPPLPTGQWALLRDRITEEQLKDRPRPQSADRLVPLLQQALARYCLATGRAVYIFVDDIHYMRPNEVPGLLDRLHGISRDTSVWLKVAGIRHQTRWFTQSPPLGLQTGHDAEIINLDVTLEEPARAREYLKQILVGYVERTAASPLHRFLGSGAIDRLVLASGGVPRDFLSLCASAIQVARQRATARAVGVQDVNHAAGTAAKVKLQELEDDAAAAREGSQAFIDALTKVRDFLLNERQITFLRIDLIDKEQHPDEYGLLQGLMDLRMLHIVNASLSSAHQAGQRSEVYLLDLSQYSGARLKQKLQVLDFVRDHLVLKKTRSADPDRVGDTPRKLIDLLRRGPLFDLGRLSSILAES